MSSSSKSPKVSKAFTVERAPGGWIVVEYEIQGSKVVSRKASQPDMRAIALETFQREIMQFWDQE